MRGLTWIDGLKGRVPNIRFVLPKADQVPSKVCKKAGWGRCCETFQPLALDAFNPRYLRGVSWAYPSEAALQMPECSPPAHRALRVGTHVCLPAVAPQDEWACCWTC